MSCYLISLNGSRLAVLTAAALTEREARGLAHRWLTGAPLPDGVSIADPAAMYQVRDRDGSVERDGDGAVREYTLGEASQHAHATGGSVEPLATGTPT